MKKKIWITATVIGFISILLFYINRHDSSFVEKNFTKYTGIDTFKTLKKYNDDHQSYIETIISKNNQSKLKNRFGFEDNLLKLKGKVESPFINENQRYSYFLIEDGYGPYGYILFALEKESDTLKVYELYGN